MIYQKSTTRCVTKQACYSKQNSAFRLNATVPCIKSVTSMSMDVKVTAVQWCPQQLKEFFADEIHRIRYQWDACLSHKNPEQVALEKYSYQDGVTFCGIFKIPQKYLYFASEVIQGDIHVDTVLLFAEHSGLAVLRVRCSKCT